MSKSMPIKGHMPMNVPAHWNGSCLLHLFATDFVTDPAECNLSWQILKRETSVSVGFVSKVVDEIHANGAVLPDNPKAKCTGP